MYNLWHVSISLIDYKDESLSSDGAGTGDSKRSKSFQVKVISISIQLTRYQIFQSLIATYNSNKFIKDHTKIKNNKIKKYTYFCCFFSLRRTTASATTAFDVTSGGGAREIFSRNNKVKLHNLIYCWKF